MARLLKAARQEAAFALSVAVGLTRNVPMIASTLAWRSQVVETEVICYLDAIRNFGAMDVCTDKTGTLTRDKIVENPSISPIKTSERVLP